MSDLKARVQPTSNTLLSVDWLLSIAYTDSSDLHHALQMQIGVTKDLSTRVAAEIGL